MPLSTREAARLDMLITSLHGDRWDILQSLAAKAKEIEMRTDLADEIVRGVLEDEAAFQRAVQLGVLPLEDVESALHIAGRAAEEASRDAGFAELGHVVGPRGRDGAECLCGWNGALREAGVHLLQVNAGKLETEITKARNAGLIR